MIELAQKLYETYQHAGGYGVSGGPPMFPWNDLDRAVQDAWRTVGAFVQRDDGATEEHVCGDACRHASDCALHNAPAEPIGPCSCDHSTPFYVIFDGPPSNESGRFIEVESADRRSLAPGEWKQRDDGLWSLGPFVEAE